ncbi:MAG: SET domain-containing protein-lysine N-methyltransferase [Spirochaetales bacterium]|nr:SET domain-containing protein-lysine N-methyltransferase [Spirochaetales bacterium]
MSSEIIEGKEEILKFFSDRKIRYLARSRVEWKPLLKKKLYKSPYYIENRAEFCELDEKYGKQIDNSEMAPVYIRKINEKVGYGLFAATGLKKGDFIGEYTGVVRETVELTESFEDGSWETDFSWDYPDEVGDIELEINGRLEGNELRFVNHGNDCNLDVEHTLHKGLWVVFFVANRDIEKDEQLFVSYGEEYWNGGFREFDELGKRRDLK